MPVLVVWVDVLLVLWIVVWVDVLLVLWIVVWVDVRLVLWIVVWVDVCPDLIVFLEFLNNGLQRAHVATYDLLSGSNAGMHGCAGTAQKEGVTPRRGRLSC